jgi:hypothetical protein
MKNLNGNPVDTIKLNLLDIARGNTVWQTDTPLKNAEASFMLTVDGFLMRVDVHKVKLNESGIIEELKS